MDYERRVSGGGGGGGGGPEGPSGSGLGATGM